MQTKQVIQTESDSMTELPTKVFQPESSSPTWFPTEGWQAVSRYWTSNDLYGAEEVLVAKTKENSSKGIKSLWLAQCLLEVRFLQSLEFTDEAEKKELDKKFLAQFDEVDKMVDFMLDEYKPDSKIVGWFSSAIPKEEQDKRFCLYLSGLVSSGYSCLYKGVYHYHSEEQIKGSYYLKKAWESLSRADKFIRENKEKTSFDPAMIGLAGFGVALFQFVMSMIPPVFQVIGQLVGFEADRENAIRLFNQAVSMGCPKSVEAGLILVAIKRLFLDQEAEAYALLNLLVTNYPDSVILISATAYLHRFEGNLAGAIQGQKRALDYHETKQNARGKCGVQREIGSCYYFQHDYENAIPYYENFLATPLEISKKNFRPTVAFNLGFCYWMTDSSNVEKIVQLYTKAKEWIQEDESFDLIAKRKMNQFMTTKQFSQQEVLYERTNALVEGKQWDKLREFISQLVDFQAASPNCQEFLALQYYATGRCDLGKKDYDSAKENLEKAIAEEPKLKQYTWIVPFALFTLAEVAMGQKRWNEATEYLDRAQKYKDFDWEKLLATFVYATKQTLKPHISN